MKNLIKNVLGTKLLKFIRPFGHGIKGYIASLINFFPARKLKIIAITGTKGKTSTVVTTGRLLNQLGYKAGYISTALINYGKEEEINNTKMSSVDAFYMQKLLKQMVKNGCKYLVVEMSSQGLEQNRQAGLFGFDIAMFLNIYPEHIEAHGSYDKYLKAKAKIFKHLRKGGQAIVTGLIEFSKETETIKSKYIKQGTKVIEIDRSTYEVVSDNGSQFKAIKIKDIKVDSKYDDIVYKTNFVADFEIENLAFAIKAVDSITSDKYFYQKLSNPLKAIYGIPGRLEYVVKNNRILSTQISIDQPKGKVIDIMIDYAHETGSMEKFLKTLSDWKTSGIYDTIIHIVSCDGVGRDDWKKPILGDISRKYSDYIFVTTDNYGQKDDPNKIIELITKNYGKEYLNQNYFVDIDRKESMINALKKAQDLLNHTDSKKIIIVSTGVGTEQGLTQPTGQMRWDEKTIWEMIYSNY